MNDTEEADLRVALDAVTALPHELACHRVLELEVKHADRRKWVWAEIGQSPFAKALAPLSKLARFALTPVGGETCDAVAKEYAASGWLLSCSAIDVHTLKTRVESVR